MTKRNEMMDRPVINKEVRDFLRKDQKQLSGHLKELQNIASERRNPVIPHETVSYFIWLLDQLKPNKILEVGTAIGFSASIFAEYTEAKIQTIERNPEMIERAKANFEDFGLTDRVEILEGQAGEWLEKLPADTFDFIFMDSAKAKYYDFFPDCMRILQTDGVLAVDDVLQGGTILQPTEEIPRRVRKIHKKLNAFLEVVLDHPALISTILPIGDGLLLITKKEDFDFSFMKEE
ncbi:Predicted O-methyltransferase YrrM [Atopostipes suicloacalis DSM 15692]|uniref:tRNA 5-hydroxyuridine methyltransferase n=1 Tax=Atopostipes suicloacalis DSM 15692 TaxID=1121025 RepID=A0A1M4YH14_9LACT|nr:O-methyltransferase [Atopostipes suicloacalis]SHF04979.1 Predicted O-methyltransferase YrrM [Atopostipes suicloacalis DSM 15692]